MEIELNVGSPVYSRLSEAPTPTHASLPGTIEPTVSLLPPASPVRGRNTIIHVKNVHKTYLLGVDGVPALRGVTLDIRRGEFIVILGKSGSGKTSMLNVLGTIDKPTKGDITLCDTVVNAKTTDDELAYLRLKKIGFVFQTFNLISSMTALENVALPMVLEGSLSAEQIERRAADLLSRVGMGQRAGHTPSQLSGGEQQRTTIARAIANEPEVLLLDEPTGDLDTKNGDLIMKMLLDLNRNENITLVMVTHDTALKYFASRVVHMIDGKIQRVEEIAPQVREHAYQELAEKVVQHEQSRSVDGSFSLFSSLNVDTLRSVAYAPHLAASPSSENALVVDVPLNSSNASIGITEVREPRTHYAFHRFADRVKLQSSSTSAAI